MVWIVCLVVVVALLVALVFWPIRLHLNLQGRGDPTGAWALAAGAQVGPLAASGLGARGVPASVQAHLFGRQVWQREVRALLEKDSKAKDDEETPGVTDRYRQLERWFEPTEVARFALGEHRRIRIESIEIDVDYSFANVALTGKILGAIYALNGVLPPQIVIRQNASWDAVDKAALALTGTIKIWPGLLIVDTLVFGVKNVKLFRRRPKEAGAAESS